MTYIHKIGDSIKWELRSLQSDGITPVNWSGYQIEISAVNKVTNSELFKVSTNSGTSDSYITVNELSTGKFNIIIKNTDNFKAGEYSVDVRYISPDGIKQTASKNVSVVISYINSCSRG